jgi:hypothetical protein
VVNSEQFYLRLWAILLRIQSIEKRQTPLIEQRIKSAPTEASDRLIDLVDRVMKRHPGKAKPQRKLFSFLMRDRPLVRPSLGRPSQKIDPRVPSQLGTWI